MATFPVLKTGSVMQYPATMTILVSTYREEDLPPGVRTCGAAAFLHKSEFGSDALRELWGRQC